MRNEPVSKILAIVDAAARCLEELLEGEEVGKALSEAEIHEKYDLGITPSMSGRYFKGCSGSPGTVYFFAAQADKRLISLEKSKLSPSFAAARSMTPIACVTNTGSPSSKTTST
jgi:hypothetical protein